MSDEQGPTADQHVPHRTTDDPNNRWKSLPPQIRPEDTIATQEVPPQPQAITDSDDPFRDALHAGG